jgi:hypothetical protein
MNGSFSTVYFYCKENDPQKNDCLSILRGLLAQQSNHCRDLIPHCYEKIQSSGTIELSTQKLAMQLLELFCDKIPKQCIIIDGLDECDPGERKTLLSFLSKMVDLCDSREPGKLRVLCVSQHYPDIEKALQGYIELKLEAKHNKKDIDIFVTDWCKKIKQKFELEIDQVDFIQESTCKRSDGAFATRSYYHLLTIAGMFLFAKLVMENFYALETQNTLLEEINVYGFPKGLEEA